MRDIKRVRAREIYMERESERDRDQGEKENEREMYEVRERYVSVCDDALAPQSCSASSVL